MNIFLNWQTLALNLYLLPDHDDKKIIFVFLKGYSDNH